MPPFRATVYPVTPTLSLDALHDRFTASGEDVVVAARLPGFVGACVSGAGGFPETTSCGAWVGSPSRETYQTPSPLSVVTAIE